MAKVNITLQWMDNNGKKGTTNVSDVNPEATNNDLYDFAEMLNDLTNNAFTGVTKTTIEDLYKTNS